MTTTAHNEFLISGRAIRILRATAWQTGAGTAHGCLVLFTCGDDGISCIGEGKLPWPVAPKFVAIWDRDVLATVSPLWTQNLCISIDPAAPRMTLDGPEGKHQRQLGAPWVQGRGGAVPVARALYMTAPPPMKTISAFAAKHVAAMLPPAHRAGLGSQWTAQCTLPDLERLIRRMTKDPAGPMLQIRDSFMPRVTIALSGFIRPSAARALPLPEALALAHYIADTGGPELGVSTCRIIDLLVHSPDLAGMQLPHHRLQLQRFPPPPQQPPPDGGDAVVVLLPEQVRAGMRKSRSLPTDERPLVITQVTPGGEERVSIAVSGYDMAAARLLQPPRGRAVVFSWCGSPSTPDSAQHIRTCLDEVFGGNMHYNDDVVIVAPNDAIALAFCAHRLPVHGLADALGGRVLRARSLVLVEAHLLGARTLAQLCCALVAADTEAAVPLVLIGDPVYGWGSCIDDGDGGAPFRDAWASGIIERGLGGRHAYGSFGSVLPGPTHTAALMDNRDATLVVGSCVADAATSTDAPPIDGATLLLTGDTTRHAAATDDAANDNDDGANDDAAAEPPQQPVVPAWKAAGEVSAGDWLLFTDCGERRRVQGIGRLSGSTLTMLRGPFRLVDADAVVQLSPPSSSSARDHRLCCGTPNGNMVRLIVHGRHVIKANTLPVRVAAAVLPGPAARHVRLSGIELTLDDIRAAAKLTGEWLTIDYGGGSGGSEAEAMGRRAKGRVSSSLFTLLRGPEDAFAPAADDILQRLREQASALVMDVTLDTAVGLAIVTSPPVSEPVPNGGSNDVAAAEDTGASSGQNALFIPPPAQIVRDMMTSDFEEAVRDRVTALLDAHALAAGDVACGSVAQRYPFTGRLSALLPAVRTLAVMDAPMRERIAIAALCKICRGQPALEAWFVASEAALLRARYGQRHVVHEHCDAVQRYMQGLTALQEAGDSAVAQALARMQAYLLGEIAGGDNGSNDAADNAS